MQTQPTQASVADHRAAVLDPRRRADAQRVCALMERITGESPVLWGSSIIGFGSRRLRYADGRESTGWWWDSRPRKAATVVT